MHRTPRVTALAAASLAAIGLAAGCSTKSNSGNSGKASQSSAAGQSSGPLGQGVTATTIKVGVTYPDLAAIRNIINLTHGDYQKAFNAVIADVNQHGGVDGRKLVPVYGPINPIGTAPADAACTKLTEDDKVFAVLAAFVPNPSCYLSTHDTPLVGSFTMSPVQDAKAPWFSSTLTPEHTVPKLLDALSKKGVFKGHKVAVTALAADQALMKNSVLPELKKLGVDVVATAINSAPTSDVNAGYQQYDLIARKFQSVGADVVVTAGQGASTAWPKALQVNRSSYLPRVVATDWSSLAGYVNDNSGNDPQVLKNAISGVATPPPVVGWNDPRLKSCIAIVQKAEPNAKINSPITATSKTPNTWVAPTAACQNVLLFVDIAKAAGKTLNNDTLNHAGESLGNVILPGYGGSPLDYGPGHHDGNGPIYLSHYDEATKNLVTDTKPS